MVGRTKAVAGMERGLAAAAAVAVAASTVGEGWGWADAEAAARREPLAPLAAEGC